MSFSKAKLTRFNDINDATPSPADYNPLEVKSRTTGGVIVGKERFSEDRPDNVSVQSGNSSSFRTPTPIKKQKSYTLKQWRNDDTEVLNEKKVECANKDVYIKELVDQIDELKGEVSNLKSHQEIIEQERDGFKVELENIEKRHSVTMEVLAICYENDQQKINEEILQLHSKLRTLHHHHICLRRWHEDELQRMTDMVGFDEKFNNTTTKYLNELKNKESEITVKEREMQVAETKLKTLECAYNTSLENCHNIRRKDMEMLQEKMEQKIANIQEIYFMNMSEIIVDDKNEDKMPAEDTNLQLNNELASNFKLEQNFEQTGQNFTNIPTESTASKAIKEKTHLKHRKHIFLSLAENQNLHNSTSDLTDYQSTEKSDLWEKSIRTTNENKNITQQPDEKEVLFSRHKSVRKSPKDKIRNLNMYTESYDVTNDTLISPETECNDEIDSVINSFKQEQRINPNLKMKFYPIENIEDMPDSDTSSDFDFPNDSQNNESSIHKTSEKSIKITFDNNECKNINKQIELITLKQVTYVNRTNLESVHELKRLEIDTEATGDGNIDIKDVNQLQDMAMVKESKTCLQKMEEKYKAICTEREKNLEQLKDKDIDNLNDSYESQIAIIKAENEIHLQQVKENIDESIELVKIQSEEEYQDTELIHKLLLETKRKEAEAVLKECEAIGKYVIGQSELEKESIKVKIKKVSEELEADKWNEDRNKYQNLIRKYEKMINEFKALEEKLLYNITLLDEEKNQYVNDNFTYHVTIHRTQETIEALTKRLFESDNDVEQLKAELEVCNTSKLQLEEKKNKLSEELDNLTKLNEDLEIQQESSSKVFENEIKVLEENILKTVDEYKDSVSKIIKHYKTKFETTEYDLQEIAKCLYEQEVLNSEAYNLIHLANIEIEDLEKNNKLLEDQICSINIELAQAKSQIDNLAAMKEQLEQKLKYEHLHNAELHQDLQMAKVKREETEILTKHVNQLQEKSESYYQYCEYYRNKSNSYEQELAEMNDINKCYIDQSKKYEDLLQQCEEMESRNSELEKLVAENEVLIGPFRQQLEAYEYERQTLLTQKCDAENEARVMGLRYAAMLGHQNQKQKIKHIVDLKEKNLNLLKANQTMEMKIRSQSKTIEKLKAELAVCPKTPKKIIGANKENTPHESYASPLRDRNQV